MVVWDEYFRFSADEVEAIGKTDSNIESHPYRLTVHLKSGRNLSINYADMDSRKVAMHDLARQIDREKRQDAEKIHAALYLLQDATNRIDKRQLRIWKQLKMLLGVKEELP